MSVLFGTLAAILVALIGLYGGLILILATPVWFLTFSRVLRGTTTDPEWAWLLGSFGIVWFALMPVAPITHMYELQPPPDLWATWIGVGAVPLLMALALVLRGRYRGDLAR